MNRAITLLIFLPMIFISCGSETNHNDTKDTFELTSEEAPLEDTQNEEQQEEIVDQNVSYDIYGDWHSYVVDHYDSIAPSESVIDSSYYGGLDLCNFEQQFENGIFYEYNGCGEGGSTEHIIFPGISKVEMYNIINTHFFLEDNTWNEDSTEYEADGAGCYYSIIEKQDTVVISTYCGC